MLSAAALKALDFSAAVQGEARTDRNLVPNEPSWGRLTDRASTVGRFVAEQVKSDRPWSQATEIAARKPAHGVRPVAYVGVVERVLYRALGAAVTASQATFDRGPDAYLSFSKAPIEHAFEEQRTNLAAPKETPGQRERPRFVQWLSTPYKYVVKSDVSAFYQFVDHGILAQELTLGGADAELVEALTELLGRVQGRGYGLPQLLDASDWLSEVYADRVERQLLRDGLAVWRFNDDFRIACRSYSDTLAAIESLDRAVRASGLILNENKTVSVKFENYFLDVVGKQRHELDDTISIDEVEEIVSDYTQDFDENPDAALEILASAGPRADAVPDLRKLMSEDFRLLRRAIGGMAAGRRAEGLEHVLKLVRYAPALTPAVCRYIQAVHPTAPQEALAALDSLSTELVASEWQRLWIVDTNHQLGAYDGGASSDRVARLASWRTSARNSVAQAAMTRALAGIGQLPLTEVVDQSHWAPPACLTYYAAGIREAVSGGHTDLSDKVVQAFTRESVLHRLLVEP